MPSNTKGMNKTVQDLLLLENQQLNNDNFLLKLKSPVHLSGILPGQFVNVEIKSAREIFLRRPFSVLDVDYQNQTISLLVKILGRGSKKLTEITPGQKISVVFPLGKSFTFPDPGDRVLLIGGGSGVAPMLFLAKMCGLPADNVHVLLGAKTINDHINVDDYLKFGHFYYTTEDGSKGERGFVIDHPVFKEQLSKFTRIYTCGPNPMMKAIAASAKKANIICEVSLENMMACGFGVCLCCVEDTNEGHKCVCTEGPVFNVNDLKW